MSDDLTALLDDSSPQTTHTLAAHEHVRALAVAIEPTRPRHAWTLRTSTTAIVGVLVLGGASAAVASPAVREWLDFTPTVTFPWTPQSAHPGAPCTAAVEVVPGSASASPGAAAAVEAATRYISTLDFGNIEKTAAYKTAFKDSTVSGDGTPGERQLTRERAALVYVTQNLMAAQLEKEGLNASDVGLRGSDSCKAAN